MRRTVVVDGRNISLITWKALPPDVIAMTFPTFILVHPDHLENRYLLEHEFEHVRQWRRFGPLGFLTRYLRDYFLGRLRGCSHHDAYLSIRFEQEARAVAQAAADRDNRSDSCASEER